MSCLERWTEFGQRRSATHEVDRNTRLDPVLGDGILVLQHSAREDELSIARTGAGEVTLVSDVEPKEGGGAERANARAVGRRGSLPSPWRSVGRRMTLSVLQNPPASPVHATRTSSLSCSTVDDAGTVTLKRWSAGALMLSVNVSEPDSAIASKV